MWVSNCRCKKPNETITEINDDKVNIVLQTDERSTESGEPVIVQMSTTNYIDTQQSIKIQLILESTQGVSITGGTGQQGASNQFSTITTLEPGESDSIRIKLQPEEAGTYNLSGEIIYFQVGSPNNSIKEQISTSFTQEREPRSIWWWAPSILAFLTGSVATAYLFKNSENETLDSIRYEPNYKHEDFSSAMKYVIIGSICVFISGTWFARYLIDVNPIDYGVALGFIIFFVGLILSYIGKLRFTPKIRVAFAFISVVSMLAIPLQLVYSVIL
jgi:hypothetical protein